MRKELMMKLVTPVGKVELRNSLKGFGLGSTKAAGTMVVKVANGKVQGSAWHLMGGAGTARVKVKDLMGSGVSQDSWGMVLDITDLSVFDFYGVRENVSKWVDGRLLVASIKKGKESIITDKTEMDRILDEMGVFFVLRVVVLATGGNRLVISLGAAPVSLEDMTDACSMNGCGLEASRIPVMEIRIPYNSKTNVKMVEYWPYEAAWVEGPRGWVLFPLIEREVSWVN